MNIDLTIIVPHCNTPDYLLRLLESIPSRDNIQVIVTDDRSDKNLDAYVGIKNDCRFGHVTFLKNTKGNKGAGTCRNIGLQYAKGTWVLFADADDFFVEGFYDIVEEYFTVEHDVVFFVPTSMDMDTLQKSFRHLHYEDIITNYIKAPTLRSELQLRYFLSSPWSKMIKLALIQSHNIRFDEILVSNDIAFTTKIGFYMSSFYVSDKTIYCVTSSSGSLTKSLNETIYDIRLDVFFWRYNFLRNHLSKKEFYMLDYLYEWVKIAEVITYKLGFKKMIRVMRRFKENKVTIINKRFLNPIFFIKTVKWMIRGYLMHRNNKRFYAREQ